MCVPLFAFGALWRCWLGGRKGIRPVKTEWWCAGVVIYLEWGADLHMAQLMPLPLIVSCFSKIQVGFDFLVPAHLGSPGQRVVERVCVCVCAPVWWQVWVRSFFLFHYLAVLCCERPAKYSSNYFFLVPDCCVVTRVPRMSKSQNRDQNLGICLAMLLYPVPMSVGAKGIFEHSSHQHSMQMVVLICRLWLLITGWIQTWNTQGFLWAWKTRGNSVQPQGKIVTNKSSFSSSFKYLVTVLWRPVMSLELMWNDPWWRSLLHVLFVVIT